MANIQNRIEHVGSESPQDDLTDEVNEEAQVVARPEGAPEVNAAQREYLLTYAGKQPEAQILLGTPALPLQRVRVFGEVDTNEWHNLLIQGDNQPVLRRLMDMRAAGLIKNADGSDGVRVVYIDPPFASEEDYETKQGKIAYSDKVAGSEFIEGLRRRLVLIRELLADDGSVFVHLDWRKSHYIKAILDEMFGEHNFINEIVWHYRSFHGQTKAYFPRKHDVILFYRKSAEHAGSFVLPRKEVALEGMIDFKNWGKYIVNGDEIRGDNYPTDVRFKRNVDKWLRDNPGETPDADDLLYTFQSQTEDDTWDIPYLDPKNKTERVDYPTQKPEALLKRIIAATSKPGDLILDCFAGSGTTLVVAEKLDRRWIGVDLGLGSIYTTQKRLLNVAASASLTETTVKVGRAKPACCGDEGCEHCAEFCCRPKETVAPVAYGKPATPFALYSSGHYDFHKLKALPFADYRTFVLRLFGAAEQPEIINGLTLDGRHRGDPVMIFDFHVDPEAQVTIEYFDELAAFLEGRVRGRLLFIAPAASLALFEDRVSTRGIDFEIRRVPYSVVAAMSERTNQATSEAHINRIIETKGFDFAAPPEVETRLDLIARTLTIASFRSRAIVRDLSEEKRGFDSLAMVLIDYDHDGTVFDLDKVEFAEQLEGKSWRVDLTEAKTGGAVAVSICDIFGNEHVEVFRGQEWGGA